MIVRCDKCDSNYDTEYDHYACPHLLDEYRGPATKADLVASIILLLFIAAVIVGIMWWKGHKG